MRAVLAFLVLAGCSDMRPALDPDAVFKAIGVGNECVKQGKSDNECAHACSEAYYHDDDRLISICRNAVKASLAAAEPAHR